MSSAHRVDFRRYSVDYIGEPKDGFAFSDYYDIENVVMWRFPIVRRRKFLWFDLMNKYTGVEMFITDWHRIPSIRQGLFQEIRGDEDKQYFVVKNRER